MERMIGVWLWLGLATTLLQAQVGSVDREALEKPALVVLGTYHMGTAGNNVFDNKPDDVLSPQRQEQIVAVVDRLKAFAPTKVLVECDVTRDADMETAYQDYLAGTRSLTRNETNQLGFRLAKALGHPKVYCVDWGIFPKDPIYNYETYVKDKPVLAQYLKDIRAQQKKFYDAERRALAGLPVLDQLALLNQPERMEKDHQGYFDIMRIGQGGEYAGADYFSWIYGRNLKILVNIIRIIESPRERILVIYGAGHAKLLNQFARESGYFQVADPLKVLGKH